MNLTKPTSFLTAICVQILFPALAWAEAQHAEAGGHHGNPAPDIGLVWSFMNFFILVGVLFYFLRKPVAEFFSTRAAETKAQAEGSQKLFAAAQQHFNEIDNKLKSAQKEGLQLIASLKEEGEMEKRRMIDNARALSEQLVGDTKRIVEQEGRRAQEILKAEAVRLATDLAEQQVRSQVSADDQTRFGNEFLGLLKKAGQS